MVVLAVAISIFLVATEGVCFALGADPTRFKCRFIPRVCASIGGSVSDHRALIRGLGRKNVRVMAGRIICFFLTFAPLLGRAFFMLLLPFPTSTLLILIRLVYYGRNMQGRPIFQFHRA